MDEAPATTAEKTENDDLYLKIWEADQKHTTTRWTVSTFFLSISFAIFGLSFQLDNTTIPRIIPQLGAVAIYWFTYALFLRFNTYTRYLRSYMAEMESSKQTTFDIQSKATAYLRSKKSPSSTQLLGYFGVGYTAVCILIGIFY